MMVISSLHNCREIAPALHVFSYICEVNVTQYRHHTTVIGLIVKYRNLTGINILQQFTYFSKYAVVHTVIAQLVIVQYRRKCSIHILHQSKSFTKETAVVYM